MRHTSNIFLIFVLVFFVSCKRHPTIASSTTQFGDDNFPCKEYAQDEVAAYLSPIPEGLLVDFREKERPRALQALTALPRKYLDVVYSARKDNNFFIKRVGPGVSSGILGVTCGTYPDVQYTAIYASETLITSIMLHEIAHVMSGLISKENPAFKYDLAKAYGEDLKNDKVSQSYTGTSELEYFAELFDSFYCSRQSYESMKAVSPKISASITQYLEPARWAQPTPSPVDAVDEEAPSTND